MTETELEQRRLVAALTREWLGTPYVHEGRIKQQCADCTFFAKVYEEAGLIEPVAIPHYPPQAILNRASSMYLSILTRYAHEISEDRAQIGDVVMYHIGRCFSHGGVIVDPGWPSIIHADMAAKKVQEASGQAGRLAPPERRFFSFW